MPTAANIWGAFCSFQDAVSIPRHIMGLPSYMLVMLTCYNVYNCKKLFVFVCFFCIYLISAGSYLFLYMKIQIFVFVMATKYSPYFGEYL